MIACKEDKKDTPGLGAQGGRPQGPSSVYAAIIAQSYSIARTIDAPGTILPNETTDMQPEISGRVVSINFNEGSFVKKGTLLIKLFDADLQAQLNKLTVQLEIAVATEKRQRELLAINGTSQQDYDNATLNVNNIKADIELLKVRISQTEVRAPFDGRLGLRNISLGAYITPSTIITNISQVNTIKVEFTVPEKYAHEMATGKTVSFETADRRKQYSAKIIASQNLISADTRNLLIRAVVSNPDGFLTPGAFVQVKVGVGTDNMAILVPTQAVIPSTRDKRLIIVRDGRAIFQVINTGYRDSARVEVVGNIQPGDTIITSGLLTIKESMPVKVKVSKP